MKLIYSPEFDKIKQSLLETQDYYIKYYEKGIVSFDELESVKQLVFKNLVKLHEMAITYILIPKKEESDE